MIVGELRHGQLIVIDRLRETVRLSEGLETSGKLSEAACARALDCLSRFGERLRAMRAASVRAAGTSTLRRAHDSREFRRRAERALGHPIDVISGLEEARLIYTGVLHSLPPFDGHRLVLDIGGGSTELILGEGERIRRLESLHLGCVAMTERFFGDGNLSRDAFDRARIAARLELRPVKAFFRELADFQTIGTSGTILSTVRVAREAGLVDIAGLTPAALETLISRVIEIGRSDRLTLPGLSERRAQVWPGGLAILVELMHAMRIPQLRISDGALREGLLHELIGRLHHEDARRRTVDAMVRRYNVDEAQAARVAQTAGNLLAQCRDAWDLRSPLAADMLDWAARLHEIGLDISHDGYQRHGSYIAANADMPGFPWSEQALLAFLIASQRRNLSSGGSSKLPAGWRAKGRRLALLLRLAVLLNRNRSEEPLPEIRLEVGKNTIALDFPQAWLHDNPLTLADLERERDYLANVDVSLSVGSSAR